jgi:hypothetical protein
MWIYQQRVKKIMKYIFCLSLFVCSALHAGHQLPYHLSSYNKDFDNMSPWQLKDRERHIKERNQGQVTEWLDEKPWRKPVHCVGACCCFWIPAATVSTIEHMERTSIGSGFGGLVAGALCLKAFVDWYQPSFPYSKKELQSIEAALRKKNQ